MKFADIILESRPCPLGCRPDDELVVMAGDRINNLPGEFRVIRCKTCGLMRTDPRPTQETMGFYYPDNYGPYRGTRVPPGSDSNRFRPVWRRRLNRIFKRLAQTDYLPYMPPGRMLEIGCASGAFLSQMAKDSWEVAGIEFSTTAAESARTLGHEVYAGPIETAAAPEHAFDLVVGWMVFEHLHDPIGALRRIHSWLKPGGWLVLATPNAGSIERVSSHEAAGTNATPSCSANDPVSRVASCDSTRVFHNSSPLRASTA